MMVQGANAIYHVPHVCVVNMVTVQVQCVQVLHAFLRRRNSERPRGSAPASEGFDFLSHAFVLEVNLCACNQ